LYTITYAGKSASEEATDFAATTRYKPLHCKSHFLIQHILNRFVENTGVIVFCADLRLICADLKTVGADLSVVCANLIADCADLTLTGADSEAFRIPRSPNQEFTLKWTVNRDRPHDF